MHGWQYVQANMITWFTLPHETIRGFPWRWQYFLQMLCQVEDFSPFYLVIYSYIAIASYSWITIASYIAAYKLSRDVTFWGICIQLQDHSWNSHPWTFIGKTLACINCRAGYIAISKLLRLTLTRIIASFHFTMQLQLLIYSYIGILESGHWG